MNASRRKRIAALIEQLENLRGDVELLQEEEQEGFDNLPESLQEADSGQAKQQAAEQLGSALEGIDEAIDCLQEAAV